MQQNAFIGKSKNPSENELVAALGPVKKLWDRTITELAEEQGVRDREWNSYSPKAGWALRLKRGGRVIVYLAPCHNLFRVSFALGDKALQAARELKLSSRQRKLLNEAPHYAEGNAVRFEVKDFADVQLVKELAKMKIEN